MVTETATPPETAPATPAGADPEVERIIRELQAAPEPGSDSGMTVGERHTVPNVGDEPILMLTRDMKSAGWVYVYNTRTRERVMCNNNMLVRQLQKVHPPETGPEWAGKPAFTKDTPSRPPERGKLLCHLHPDHPQRAHYASIGIGPTENCRKSNLVTVLGVRVHMEHRHPTAWKAIQENKAEMERAEDRALQQSAIEAQQRMTEALMAQMTGGAPAPGKPGKVA